MRYLFWFTLAYGLFSFGLGFAVAHCMGYFAERDRRAMERKWNRSYLSL